MYQNKIRDEKHATIVQDFVKRFMTKKWTVVGYEIPYNYFGNRGFIDVLLKKQFQRESQFIVAEIKTEIVDVGATLRQIEKSRQFLLKARPDIFKKTKNDKISFPLVLPAADKNIISFARHWMLLQQVKTIFLVPNGSARNQIIGKLKIAAAMQARHEEIDEISLKSVIID